MVSREMDGTNAGASSPHGGESRHAAQGRCNAPPTGPGPAPWAVVLPAGWIQAPNVLKEPPNLSERRGSFWLLRFVVLVILTSY